MLSILDERETTSLLLSAVYGTDLLINKQAINVNYVTQPHLYKKRSSLNNIQFI